MKSCFVIVRALLLWMTIFSSCNTIKLHVEPDDRLLNHTHSGSEGNDISPESIRSAMRTLANLSQLTFLDLNSDFIGGRAEEATSETMEMRREARSEEERERERALYFTILEGSQSQRQLTEADRQHVQHLIEAGRGTEVEITNLEDIHCHVCLSPEIGEKVRKLGCRCNSYYHANCIKKWFTTELSRNEVVTCPACRQDLSAIFRNSNR